MNDTQKEFELDRAIEALPREITPDEDLWPNIHERITSTTSRVVLPSLAIAASLMLMIGGALYWPNGNTIDKELNLETMLIASVSVDMDKAFEKRRTVLLSKFGNNHALTKNWEDQLEELEDARKAIKESLEDNPNNFYLLKALQNIHEQQLNLILRVHDESWQSI